MNTFYFSTSVKHIDRVLRINDARLVIASTRTVIAGSLGDGRPISVTFLPPIKCMMLVVFAFAVDDQFLAQYIYHRQVVSTAPNDTCKLPVPEGRTVATDWALFAVL